jgi:diaminobutyrate-2-oxoglutarate transaminase
MRSTLFCFVFETSGLTMKKTLISIEKNVSKLSKNSQNFSVFESHESEVRSYCRDFPTIFSKASGSILTDVDGKNYIDFFCGAGALNYGHNNKILKEYLLKYIESDGPTHTLDFYTVAKQEFITFFQEYILSPRELSYKLQFPGPTGTNAVEAALKLARKVTGRTNIVAFSNAFHGMSLGALAATANPVKRQGSGVSLSGITFMPYEGYLGSDIDSFLVLEKMLESGSGNDKPAAIILETIQGEGGLSYISPTWAEQVKDLAESLGALLIIDDIQAGCGRSGTFFSFESLNIIPDIVCLSKSISGYGLPMSLNLIRPDIDIWEPGEHNGTFRGNNFAFVTARATIETYWNNSTFQIQLKEKIKYMDEYLAQMSHKFKQYIPSLSITGRGFMRGLSVPIQGLATSVSFEAFQHGVLVETCGINSQVIKLMPPLTISHDDMSTGMKILESVIESVVD